MEQLKPQHNWNQYIYSGKSIDPFSLLPMSSTTSTNTTHKESNEINTKQTRIYREIIHAINKDPLYGPRHDKQRRVIGLEHEIMLEQALHAMSKS